MREEHRIPGSRANTQHRCSAGVLFTGRRIGNVGTRAACAGNQQQVMMIVFILAFSNASYGQILLDKVVIQRCHATVWATARPRSSRQKRSATLRANGALLFDQ